MDDMLVFKHYTDRQYRNWVWYVAPWYLEDRNCLCSKTHI